MRRRDFLKSLLSLILLRPSKRPLATGQYFLIPPTTHHVTETSAFIYYWLAQMPYNTNLVITQATQEVQRIPLQSAQTILEVTNLEPSTSYDYWIEADGRIPPYLDLPDLWGKNTLHTQPFKWPIRFAAIGDSGFGDNITKRLAEHMASHELHFFIHLGDIVYKVDEYNNNHALNWALKYFLPFQKILQRVAHYPTVGNHDRDRPTRLADTYFYDLVFPPFNEDYFGQRQWYSFAANDVRFLSLNSQSFYTDVGLADQNIWLDEQLANSGYRTTIPFFHIPFWTSTSVHPNDGAPVAQTWEHRFVNAINQIRLVMNGHAHHYERIERANITYVTSGGGSASIYAPEAAITGSRALYALAHYLLVEVHEDRIALSAYNIENQVIDQKELLF